MKSLVQVFQLFPAQGAVCLDNLGDGMAGRRLVVKRVDALSTQLSQLLSALGGDVVDLGHGVDPRENS
jgi:hypothetical protein